MRWGREVTRAFPSGTEISKGIKEQDSKSVFDVEKTSRSRRAHHPVARWPGGQVGSCKSHAISAGVAGVGPRREEMQNAGLASIVPLAPARATTRRELPPQCQANA